MARGPMRMLGLLTLALAMRHAFALPSDWIQYTSSDCLSHPTVATTHHGAPITDPGTQFILTQGTPSVYVTKFCPGKNHTLWVVYPDPRFALITADEGYLDTAFIKTAGIEQNQQCLGKRLVWDSRALVNAAPTTAWAAMLTMPCESGNSTLHLFSTSSKASGQNNYLQAGATLQPNFSCADPICGFPIPPPSANDTAGPSPIPIPTSMNMSENLNNTGAQNYSTYPSAASTVHDPREVWHSVHGALMIAAWCFFLPVGTIFSRHGWLFEGRRVAGMPVWFQLHRGFQLLGTGVFIAGFIIAMVKFPSSNGSKAYDAHRAIGFSIVGMIAIQIFLGVARPKPTCSKRKLWRSMHVCWGRLMLLAAWANIFLGIVMWNTVYGEPLVKWLTPAIVILGLVILCDLKMEAYVQWFLPKLRAARMTGVKEQTADVEAAAAAAVGSATPGSTAGVVLKSKAAATSSPSQQPTDVWWATAHKHSSDKASWKVVSLYNSSPHGQHSPVVGALQRGPGSSGSSTADVTDSHNTNAVSRDQEPQMGTPSALSSHSESPSGWRWAK